MALKLGNTSENSGRFRGVLLMIKALRSSFATLLFLLSCVSLQAASLEESFDEDDPGKFIKYIAAEFLQEKKLNPSLVSSPTEDLEKFWAKKMDAYFNVHDLLTGILIKSRKAFFKWPEADQNRVAGEFKKFFVRDNMAHFKKIMSASSITVLSSVADVSIGHVKVSVQEAGSKPLIVDILLSRGWSSWKVSDIVFNKVFLSDLYRARFKQVASKDNIDEFIDALKTPK